MIFKYHFHTNIDRIQSEFTVIDIENEFLCISGKDCSHVNREQFYVQTKRKICLKYARSGEHKNG